MYNYFIFDLDGTLTDSGLGIINSVCYALNKLGVEVKDRSELNKFIGPPLQESFKEFYGFDEEKCEVAVKYYREYYKEKGIFENELYSGIVELLAKLKEENKKVILATSKPEAFAIKIIKYFKLDQYFDFIAGATMDGKRSKKHDVIKYVLEKYEVPDISLALMIGDREYDILGASKNNIDSLGVLWGYGSYDELKVAGANYIVNKLSQILKYV